MTSQLKLFGENMKYLSLIRLFPVGHQVAMSDQTEFKANLYLQMLPLFTAFLFYSS